MKLGEVCANLKAIDTKPIEFRKAYREFRKDLKTAERYEGAVQDIDKGILYRSRGVEE